jgi:WD40-like Beta Propeller Repeat
MLLPAERRPSVAPIDDGAEALIREARRRARRRRVRRLAVVAVLIGTGAGIYAVLGGGSGGVITESAMHPYANLRAFKGQGELGFISRGQAWVLDGERGALRRLPVPVGFAPSSPVFSPDGRWIAYLITRSQNLYGPSELWIARGDGTDAHQVRGLVVNQFVGWSPSSDLIAVEAGVSKQVPNGSPTALDLVAASGHVRALFSDSAPRLMATPGRIWSAVWSPSGRSLAVSTYSPDRGSGTQILDVPVAAGRRPTVWLSIRNSQRLTGALSCGSHCGDNDAIAQLGGWWPKWGIAFWVFSSGMTHNSDSTPLAVITRPGAKPRLVAQTLSDGTTDAVNAGPGGALAVVASTESAGREYVVGKTVERCSPASSGCRPLPGASIWAGTPLTCKPCFGAPATGPGSAVSLDPAWSPDGTLLAYVKAPAYRSSATPSLQWFQAHQLYVWNSQTNTDRRIGSISGASLPTWSRDGKSLLYVSDDGLWLTDVATGKAAEIEHPLYPDSAWNKVQTTDLSFYGQIPWSKQFSWHSFWPHALNAP